MVEPDLDWRTNAWLRGDWFAGPHDDRARIVPVIVPGFYDTLLQTDIEPGAFIEWPEALVLP